MHYFQHFERPFVSISDQVAIHAKFRGDQTALIQGSQRLSWKQLDAQVNRIARALVASGLGKGDRVCLLVDNSIWSLQLILGIWRAGAGPVPLSTMMSVDILAGMVNDSGATRLFCTRGFVSIANAVCEQTGAILIDQGDAFAEFLHDTSSQPFTQKPAPEDLAVIIYSSGTTGIPKGIAHSHGARLDFAQTFASEFRYQHDSVALSMIPPHSNGSWLTWMPALIAGATTVILPEFTPEEFCRVVREHKPTHVFLVPTICAALLQYPEIEEAGLDCFVSAVTAGAPMPDDVKAEMIRLTGGGLCELWGFTEGVATVIQPEDIVSRYGSVGRPITGCDIRIINQEDKDITRSGVGEIVGFSGGMMSGYWNREDANQEIVWRDEQGKLYLRTGDIGEVDNEGFLYLRGRKKDMLISGGYNVYPVDLEAILLQHEAISDACVVGVEHDKWGETPVAFVIPSAGTDLCAEQLKDWANQRLAKHQRLSDLVICKVDFPRNTLGKVIKNELKSKYLQEACL